MDALLEFSISVVHVVDCCFYLNILQIQLQILRFLFWTPTAIVAVTIFILSSIQSLNPPDLPFEWKDKFFHALAYFALCVALQLGFAYEGVTISRQMWIPIITSALYGMSDEFHQLFVPGRTAAIDDWIADVVGAVLTIPFATIIRKIKDYTLAQFIDSK
jgi:VanZ family protein